MFVHYNIIELSFFLFKDICHQILDLYSQGKQQMPHHTPHQLQQPPSLQSTPQTPTVQQSQQSQGSEQLQTQQQKESQQSSQQQQQQQQTQAQQPKKPSPQPSPPRQIKRPAVSLTLIFNLRFISKPI